MKCKMKSYTIYNKSEKIIRIRKILKQRRKSYDPFDNYAIIKKINNVKEFYETNKKLKTIGRNRLFNGSFPLLNIISNRKSLNHSDSLIQSILSEQDLSKSEIKNLITNKIYNKPIKSEKEFMYNLKNGNYKDNKFIKYDGDIEFTPFDLKEENEEGYFDDDYNYIKRKEEYDPWYESVKDEIKKKEMLQKKKKRNDNDKNSNESNSEINTDNKKKDNEDEDDISKYGDEDLYYKEEKITKEEENEIKNEVEEYRIKLIKFLEKNENVNKALKRLKPKTKNEDKSLFNELLNIISKLTELSYFDVYTDNIEKIIKEYGIENLYLWKYKTKIDNEEEIFQEFSTKTMKKWIKEDYFKETDKLNFYFMFTDPINKEKNKDSNKWFNTKSDLFNKYLL
jgi:hypothetical protein